MKQVDVKAEFGRQVRALREEKGWSQEHLAAVVGLDRSYVGGVERGERNISIENICKLAASLDVSPEVMFVWWEKSR
ncbi:helix-turn-helix transcriptional regulator [Phycisphaeraceae bacterium D3-23]